jgi:hypothetical protein
VSILLTSLVDFVVIDICRCRAYQHLQVELVMSRSIIIPGLEIEGEILRVHKREVIRHDEFGIIRGVNGPKPSDVCETSFKVRRGYVRELCSPVFHEAASVMEDAVAMQVIPEMACMLWIDGWLTRELVSHATMVKGNIVFSPVLFAFGENEFRLIIEVVPDMPEVAVGIKLVDAQGQPIYDPMPDMETVRMRR